MKKHTVLLCAAALACVLAACGQKENGNGAGKGTAATEAAANTEMEDSETGVIEIELDSDKEDANGQFGDGADQPPYMASDTFTAGQPIPSQTFTAALHPLGEVTFVSYEPDLTKGECGDAVFVIEQEGKDNLVLPFVYPENDRPGEVFVQVEAVSFPDYDRDGNNDIIIICEYEVLLTGHRYSEVRLYYGDVHGKFYLNETLMTDVNSALAEKTIPSVLGFLGVRTDTAAKSDSWQQQYIRWIKESESSRPGEWDGYDLIYVDEDDIPELVAIGSSEATGCKILDIHDGEFHETQMNRLNFTYIQKENLLCNSEGLMDCYYDRVFSFVDGRLTMIAEGIWGAWGKREFDADGNIIYTYSWNGNEMSEDEYETSLEAIYNRSTAGSYTWPGISAEEMTAKLEDWGR